MGEFVAQRRHPRQGGERGVQQDALSRNVRLALSAVRHRLGGVDLDAVPDPGGGATVELVDRQVVVVVAQRVRRAKRRRLR